MKKLILAVALIATFVTGSALANLSCGLQPLKPIGCMNGSFVCMCDDNGCRWVLVNC